MSDDVAGDYQEYREEQRIWSSLPGSQALIERYGHYPTMHDAHILRIEINSLSRAITINFYYYDGPGGPENDVHTIFAMCWTGVVTFEHYFEDNWLYEMTLKSVDGYIETTMLETMKGVYGKILAERIEILNVHAPVVQWECDDLSIKEIRGFRFLFI